MRSVSPADDVVAQLDVLIREYGPKVKMADRGYGPYLHGTTVEQGAACTRLSAAIDRSTRHTNPYRDEAERIQRGKSSPSLRAVALLGVVEGLRDDYAAGQMKSVEELVHADLFSDFLDMAKELLGKGFKDPAAVLAGSVLEEHLRKLAGPANVPVVDSNGKRRKADGINAELAKVGVYKTLEQKSVTAWLDLRNHAAHGEYDEYDHKQVANLIDSLRDFLARHPA